MSSTGRSQVGTWLHRIVVNCVLDLRRARSRGASSNFDEWSLVPAPSADGRTDERLAELRRAIESLPETLRFAFVATVIDGYSYKEAAEMLGVAGGTVGSRVCEARRLIREAMLKADQT